MTSSTNKQSNSTNCKVLQMKQSKTTGDKVTVSGITEVEAAKKFISSSSK